MNALPAADLAFFQDGVLEGLEGQRVLVTGGTGFVGTWLLEAVRLQQSGPRELLVPTRDPEAFLARHPAFAGDARFRFLEGDVRDLELRGAPVDAVLHGATPASKVLNEGSPLEMADVIVRGTERVLDVARLAGARRFLFLSSGLAYGRQPADCAAIAEHQMGHLDSMEPGAAYGNAKHFAEHLCLQHGIAHGFEVCIARLFAFVGPLLPLDAHFAAGNFLRDGLAGKRIQVQGDGTPLRSYLHAAELAHWLWTLMARGEAGQAYNVGSDEAVSIRELAELTGRVCGVGVDVLGTPVPNRAPARYVPDIRKAAGLGLAPRWDLETSIRRTLAWHQGREIA